MVHLRLQVLTNTYHKAMKVVKENGRLLLYRVLPNKKLVKTVSGILFFNILPILNVILVNLSPWQSKFLLCKNLLW